MPKHIYSSSSKKSIMMEKQNFLEAFNLTDANNVPLETYTFVGYSERRGYIFKLRAKKNNDSNKDD